VKTYLDTSALIKLVVAEPESPALRTYLGTIPDDTLFTAALTRTELIRALRRVDPAATTRSRHLLGGLAMGLLAAWLVRGDNAAEPLRLFLGVGVLGGFTTFSAFSLEMAQMVQRGQGMMAAAYAAVSVILALGAVFAGMMLARTIWT
jgi:CrcB protein